MSSFALLMTIANSLELHEQELNRAAQTHELDRNWSRAEDLTLLDKIGSRLPIVKVQSFKQ